MLAHSNTHTLVTRVARTTQVAVVKALVEYGEANPNIANVEGNTPLHIGCEKLPKSKAVVEYLVQNANANR